MIRRGPPVDGRVGNGGGEGDIEQWRKFKEIGTDLQYILCSYRQVSLQKISVQAI